MREPDPILNPVLALLALLEPAAATAPIDYAIQLSYAVSLRRIADALCEPVPRPGNRPSPQSPMLNVADAEGGQG